MQSYSQGSELQLANLTAEVAAIRQRLVDYEQRLALIDELDEYAYTDAKIIAVVKPVFLINFGTKIDGQEFTP